MQLQHCCKVLQCIAFVQSYLISLQFCNCNAITIFCCNLFNKNCKISIFVKWRSGTASGGDNYGIYFNKKLVYIGKTNRNFYQRFSEHKSNMKYQGGKLYEEMRKFKEKNLDNKINIF